MWANWCAGLPPYCSLWWEPAAGWKAACWKNTIKMHVLFVLWNTLRGTLLFRNWPEFNWGLKWADVLLILCYGLFVKKAFLNWTVCVCCLAVHKCRTNRLYLYLVFCHYHLSQSPLLMLMVIFAPAFPSQMVRASLLSQQCSGRTCILCWTRGWCCKRFVQLAK